MKLIQIIAISVLIACAASINLRRVSLAIEAEVEAITPEQITSNILLHKQYMLTMFRNLR